jgi:O-methyltransferase involved in polyketide biosynthesis
LIGEEEKDMSEDEQINLNGTAESLLVTLYMRALESQRQDALLKDERAVDLAKKIGEGGLYDFTRMRLLHLTEMNKLVIILRNRKFDRSTRNFLERHPNAVVVHIGCGFDTRFERVDNGQVEWFDLDFPDIIELRRKLIGDEGERYHLLGCSALDEAWIKRVGVHHAHPFLFLAEGVSMHLREEQNKWLVRTLFEHFPGAEYIFDAYSPVHKMVSNLQTARFGFKTYWGVWHGRELEKWAEGIRLLDEWGYMDEPEPRLAPYLWIRPFELLFRPLRVYHFQLGVTKG